MEGGGGGKTGCEFLILICVCGGGEGGVKVDKRIMRLGGGGSYKITEITEGGMYSFYLFIYLFIY